MVAPNAPPLPFRLPESRGHETALAELLGRRRIVLAFSPDREYLGAVSADANGLSETLAELYEMVASMPMRQQEIQERQEKD